jgi:hypothetical protein
VANCKQQTAALVELARHGDKPGAALRAHLASCEACEARWQAELALAEQFRSMRVMAMANSAASQTRRDIRAAGLMKTMVQRTEPLAMPARVLSPRWMLSAAAAVLLAVGIGYFVGARHSAAPLDSGSPVYEANLQANLDDDFVDVPFALPPVPGEVVRIVHSNLNAEELATMGINLDIDPDSDSVGADVMIGEDGFPRAVRLTDASDVTQF